jgi:hypothetical protein
MNKLQQLLKTPTALGVIFGSALVGAPVATEAVSAQATNPCPGIYYEEPYASRLVVPEGCPPNAATQRQAEMGTTGLEPVTPGTATTPEAASPGVIPAPEERSEPIAMVMPTDGMVSVKLINNTNALITYEAVGHTEPRTLSGSEEVTMTDLPLPLTLTMVRQDDGFLSIETVESDPGTLAVSLDEEETLIDMNQGVLRIQEDGGVYAN